MNSISNKKAQGEAHSKLILIGEHAVVYGKPAIAMPFPLKARSVVEKSFGSIMFESAIYTGLAEYMPEKMKGISDCIGETLRFLNQPFDGLNIRIESSIPLGRGLGSSAAVAIAVVRSLFSIFGQELSQRELFSLVQIAETHAHGNPSGIDMAVESSSCPIWFQKGKDIVPLVTGGPLYIIVGDTGRIGDTHKAVGNVREKYLLDPEKVQESLDLIGKIAAEARDVLMNGDMYLLGKLLDRNQEELIALGVSDDGLNMLIKAARKSGALGAKLTGGGLGGCMMALAPSMEKAEIIAGELMGSGASKSWYFSTEENVLYTSQDQRRGSL